MSGRQVAVVDEVRDSNTVGDDVNQGAFTEILGQPPSAENRPSGVVALGRVAAMASGPAQEKLIEPNTVPDELQETCSPSSTQATSRKRSASHRRIVRDFDLRAIHSMRPLPERCAHLTT